jgi:hypothetical protein
MSANFEQISGPQGRLQTLTPNSAVQTFLFNPKSLKGMLPGGDFLYTDRFRARITGSLQCTSGTIVPTPNWQQMASAFRNVRVWSPFLGEVVNKTLTSVPLLANHDAFFVNGFQPQTRERPPARTSSSTTVPVEYEFEIPFKRNYLTSPWDSSIWLPLFEGGQIEIDLAPSNTFANLFGVGSGWTMTGTWTCELVADWTPDRQPLIHTPIQSRLYRVVTVGPEYTLKGVGSSQGLDGVVKGCRLPVLSWLGSGDNNANTGFHDNGFYSAFQSGGILFGAGAAGGLHLSGVPNITRLDIPFRDQRSIQAVSAWVSSFLQETAAIRPMPFLVGAPAAGNFAGQNDMMSWPYARDSQLTDPGNVVNYQGSLINSALDFFPLLWPYDGQKIVDAQKFDGDLTFTADLQDPPANSILHLFRTDEICSFSQSKVMDIMERMGCTHVSRGGSYVYVVKYQGLRRAGDSTQWGLPLKIVRADQAK